jgi:uncharacterized protein YcbX
MPILTELTLYPVKSCGGIALREATLTASGLMSEYIYDREWMVVGSDGRFLSQRDHPKMALITPSIKGETLELRAPGMLPLAIPLDLPHPDDARTLQVQVWDDIVPAYDCDDITATWFSHAIGITCRLVRFHPDARRSASPKWTADAEAPTLFADGFPVLVIGQASLDDLNQRLAACGRPALSMNRFRPNIVIDGMGAYEEDMAAAFAFGSSVLKPVKPCARCTIPAVDQASAVVGPDPLDILQSYRANPRVDGGITFGMNAIVARGDAQLLRVGQSVDVDFAF